MLAAEFRTLADLPPELTGPLFARVRQVSEAMATALGDADGSFIAVNNTVTQSVPTCTSTSYRVHAPGRTAPDRLDAGLLLRAPVLAARPVCRRCRASRIRAADPRCFPAIARRLTATQAYFSQTRNCYRSRRPDLRDCRPNSTRALTASYRRLS
jgi:hypothetical protein